MRITNDVEKLNDVGTSTHVLENFNLTLDLLLLYRFKDFNDTLGIGPHVCPFKYLKMEIFGKLS